MDSASGSDPEYLGEQGPDPDSSEDEAAAQAAAVPAPKQPPPRACPCGLQGLAPDPWQSSCWHAAHSLCWWHLVVHSSALLAIHDAQSMSTGEKLPSGHVRCPNCAKMLPQAFINSHLDSCLTGSKGGGGGIWGTGGSRVGTTSASAQRNGVRSSSGGGGHAHSTANGLGSGSLAGRAAGSGSIGKQLKVCMCNVSSRLLSDSQVCSDAHAVR